MARLSRIRRLIRAKRQCPHDLDGGELRLFRQAISEDLGVKLKNGTLNMLGRTKKGDDRQGEHDHRQWPARRLTLGRVAQIKAQTEETTSDEQHAKVQLSLCPTLGDSARSKEVARGSTLTL